MREWQNLTIRDERLTRGIRSARNLREGDFRLNTHTILREKNKKKNEKETKKKEEKEEDNHPSA